MELDLVSLVVEDYDDAIAFFVDAVGFQLTEDSPSASTVTGDAKRWVVVRPPQGGPGLLLAQASDDDQRAAVGAQTGGRVSFFLNTDNFEGQHQRMSEAGIRFITEPRTEPYGIVAVWEDCCGNRWDLIEPAAETATSSVPAPAAANDVFPAPGDIGAVLFSEAEIAARVAAIGAEITHAYAGRTPLIVAVLKGSMIFVSDLVRAVKGPLEMDVLAVSSYGAATKSSGVVRIIKDLDQEVSGRDVILVEDIVDSGLTMRYLLDHLANQGPASLASCTLLQRESSQVDGLAVDYVGFTLPPAFVIGYGLDVNQRFRHLPYIASYAGA